MTTIPQTHAPVLAPLARAALLLAAIPQLRVLGLPHPTVAAVVDALGVTRSRAYLLKERLQGMLVELVQPTGRPSAPPAPPAPPALATELLGYLVENPGAIRAGPVRQHYTVGLLLFVLDLLERHQEVPLAACAEALVIPYQTLRAWLRGETIAVEPEPSAPPRKLDPSEPQLKTLLAEWDAWKGGFLAFCEHIQEHCRLPFGRHHIATILEACGVRLPRRRPCRSPDEDGLRNAFLTFFPHAQWGQDGTLVPVVVDGVLFVFNVELDVDTYSAGFVGAHVSPTEDSDAVIAAFRDGLINTGATPLALLADNKPCNHTEGVDAALGTTLRVRTTPYRPENNGHVEGGLGLLKPNLAGLELDASGSRRKLARSYLENLVTAVCRAINHRPRRDRGGRSRADLLQDQPTAEQIDAARRHLTELVARQKKARETCAARQDPIVRSRLAAAFDRFGLDDPEGHLLTAIARYPLEAVVDGIAIFGAKHTAGTLPDGVDARYLLGIVRNISDERETLALGEALWEERRAAGDLVAADLERRRDHLSAHHSAPEPLLGACLDRGLRADARLERLFWLNAAARVITEQVTDDRRRLFRLATRRLAVSHAEKKTTRSFALRFLAAKVQPLR